VRWSTRGNAERMRRAALSGGEAHEDVGGGRRMDDDGPKPHPHAGRPSPRPPAGAARALRARWTPAPRSRAPILPGHASEGPTGSTRDSAPRSARREFAHDRAHREWAGRGPSPTCERRRWRTRPRGPAIPVHRRQDWDATDPSWNARPPTTRRWCAERDRRFSCVSVRWGAWPCRHLPELEQGPWTGSTLKRPSTSSSRPSWLRESHSWCRPPSSRWSPARTVGVPYDIMTRRS